MIDYRYHLISLVAVFLALGVGVLVGNSFVGLASLDWQNQAVARLDRDVKLLRHQQTVLAQQNAQLQSRLQSRERAERALMPRTLQGVLQGRSVAIVVCGDLKDEELVGAASAAVGVGGGQVISTTRVQDGWLPEVGRTRLEILARLGISPGDPDGTAKATRQLAVAIVSGEWSRAIHDVAQQSRGLSLDGDYSTPVDMVLLLTAASSTERLARAAEGVLPEQYLVDGWKGRARVVAAEPEVAPVSMVPVFQRKSIPTVDNVDTAVGQIGAVLALAGGETNYGVKPTAQKPIPAISGPG